MQTVAILGAGDLGGALARRLAEADTFHRIVLIDAARAVAAGKALDIQQSGPIERFDTRLDGTDDAGAVMRADIVVVADQHGGGEWIGDASLELIGRVGRFAPAVPLVFAGARQREVMARALRELRVGAARLVGSAPVAAMSAACALVAPDLDASPVNVQLGVLGVPPAWVLTWAEAATMGEVSPVACARVERLLAASWPPGTYSLASAAAAVVRAIATSSRRRFCCFAAVSAGGAQQAVASVPVTLGPAGVRGVHLPTLSIREQVAFDGALERCVV